MSGYVVRQAFYALVCFFALAFASWAVYDVASYALRRVLFLEADRYYFTSADLHRSPDEPEVFARNRRSADQNMLSRDIPILLVNLPLLFWAYPKVREGDA